MLTTMLIGAAVAASGPAVVSTSPVRDSNAIYVRTEMTDGSTVYTGQYRDTGKRFRLTVKGDSVRGWVGGKPVAFPASKAGALLR